MKVTLARESALKSHAAIGPGFALRKFLLSRKEFLTQSLSHIVTEPRRLLLQVQALAHPARLWIVAQLAEGGRAFVSQLAREAGISRPLMKMHLSKLETAGLVVSAFETAKSGKAANFYELAPFAFMLDPKTITQAGPFPKPGALHTNGDFDG